MPRFGVKSFLKINFAAWTFNQNLEIGQTWKSQRENTVHSLFHEYLEIVDVAKELYTLWHSFCIVCDNPLDS